MKSVLLVEDSVHDIELAREAFEQTAADVEMVVAEDGGAALSYLQTAHENRRSPLMILLDVNMPKMGGFEVLERIKSDSHLRNIPVVLFSSSMEQSDLKSGYRLGANSYVVKPISFSEYLNTIRSISDFWLDTNNVPAAA